MAEFDELTYNGLVTKDFNTLVQDLKDGFQNTYSINGEELNFDSNTPDGNIVNIMAELGAVIREMITEVYNSCDPSKCSGAVQDTRYQINYLTRNTGTYTIQNIAVTTNKTVDLKGLDGDYANPDGSAYTVADNNGNIWYLIDSTTIVPGITQLPFRAKEIGQVIPTIGTITNQVTIIDGVISVINNVGYTKLGVEEESDSNFRIRREQSTANASLNNVDAIVGNLLALEGVDAVRSHENRNNSTDATGTPAHSIWFIVEGGANTEIAKIIYANIGGAGTKGTVSIPLLSTGGQNITINFDRPSIMPLYIKFDLQEAETGSLTRLNQTGVKNYIAENLLYDIGENPETSKITEVCSEAITSNGGGAYALNVEISTGGTATASVTATGITAATVDVVSFQTTMGNISTDNYDFIYTANGWTYNSNLIALSDYGIVATGTPVANDKITIAFTQGTWTDYIQVSTLADKFLTDSNKIYITAVSA